MTRRPRWMRTMIEDAKTARVSLPWQRGLRRDAVIARRYAALAQPRAANA